MCQCGVSTKVYLHSTTAQRLRAHQTVRSTSLVASALVRMRNRVIVPPRMRNPTALIGPHLSLGRRGRRFGQDLSLSLASKRLEAVSRVRQCRASRRKGQGDCGSVCVLPLSFDLGLSHLCSPVTAVRSVAQRPPLCRYFWPESCPTFGAIFARPRERTPGTFCYDSDSRSAGGPSVASRGLTCACRVRLKF